MDTNRRKIFQTIQSKLALIGFERNLRPFNQRQKWTYIVSAVSLATMFIYLLLVANSPKEYMASIFICGVGTLITISHISVIVKTETIFKFISEFEEIINGSEFLFFLRFPWIFQRKLFFPGSKYPASNKLYEKTNRQIEMISKVAYFALIYVSVPAIILPKSLLCFYVYFSSDLGPESFELSVPAW